MSMRDDFFARGLHGTLPLLLWGAHFFVSYALVAAQCSPAAVTADAPSGLALGLLSAGAFGACLGLLWIALRRVRAAGGEPALHDWAALGSSVLGLAGIAWTTVPLFLLDGCG
ncbi:MAG: hypothetical protein ACXWVF_09060 [Telluria sp.]